jgi:hypothetical protein
MFKSVNQKFHISGKSKNFGHLQILLIPMLLTLGLCGAMAWYISDLYNAFQKVEARDMKIINLSNRITYFDEVLTSSARLAATTGDGRWEKRYLELRWKPKLLS